MILCAGNLNSGETVDCIRRTIRVKITPSLQKCLTLAFALALSVPLAAVAPEEFNYQGKITDAAGNPLAGTKDIAFTIFDHPTAISAPNQKYTETHTGVPITQGLFNVRVGSKGTGLAAVFQNGANLYLEVKVGTTVLSPRQKLVATPYALAVAAGSVGDAEISNLSASKITPGTFGNGDYTFTGNLSLPAGSTPTLPDQVVNKGYVDALGTGPQFLGVTPSSYDGNLGGYVGANAKCQLTYPGSHICSGNELVRSGNSVAIPTAWVNPDQVGEYERVGFIFNLASVGGTLISVNAGSITCNSWQIPTSQNLHRGPITAPKGFSAATCNTLLPIACCK
jgi:hypothetical protein